MRPARKSTSIVVFVSAIALSYAIAQFSQGVHTRSPAPLTLSQIHLVNGTIYSLQSDLRTADPAHIAKDIGRRGEYVVFSDCAPAAPSNLMGHYNSRMCSLLRNLDRRLYVFEFASDVREPHDVTSDLDQH